MKKFRFGDLLPRFIFVVLFTVSILFADRILLVCDVSANANNFKTYLESLGHTVTVVGSVPSNLSKSQHDQFWIALYGSANAGKYQPADTTRVYMKAYLKEGGKIALFCDHSSGGNWGDALAAAQGISAFINDVVPDSVKGQFYIEKDAANADWIEVDTTAAILANPDGAAEFISNTYRVFWPGYVKNTNIAGGYPVLKIQGQQNKKVGIAFSSDNLDAQYAAGRVFVFTDLGNALGDLFSGNTPVLKFIASFTTGTVANISISPTEVKEDTTIAKGAKDLTFTDRTHVENIKIMLSDTLSSVTTVDYTVTGITAAEGSDYTLPSSTGTLSFAVGSKDASIPVTIIDDILHEGDQTFKVKITNANPVKNISFPTGDSLEQVITIIDDDPDFANIPVANDDSITLDEGGMSSVLSFKKGETCVLWNDYDADSINNDSLTVTAQNNVALNHGTLTLNSDGTFLYTHDNSENFADQFAYTVTDKGGNSATATVFIKINPVNDNIPLSDTGTITLNEGSSSSKLDNGIGNLIAALVSDSDYDASHANDSIFIISSSNGNYGTFSVESSGSFSYVHDGTEHFSDTVSFVVSDKVGHLDTGYIFVTINPVNDNPPVVTVSGMMLDENCSVDTLLNGVKNLLSTSFVTDLDMPNDSVYISSTPINTNGSVGKFIVNSDGTFKYDYIADSTVEVFSDTIKFDISDNGKVHTVPVTIIVTINPVNDNSPQTVTDIINVDSIGGTATVLANGQVSVLVNDNDLDLPYDKVKALKVYEPQHGTLTLNDDGTFLYKHDGSGNLSDTAYYVAIDSASHTSDTTMILVGINLTWAHKPDALDDTISVNEGAVANLLKNGGNSVLLNDNANDPLDNMTVQLMDSTSTGSLILNSNGTFSYTHNSAEVFNDFFTYVVTDLGSQKDTATVHIFINPVNDNGPIPDSEFIVVDEEGVVDTLTNGYSSVLANDYDSDAVSGNDYIFAILSDSTKHGTILFYSDGTFMYSHDGTENFTDQFIYSVSDTANPAHTKQQTVKITINPVNSAPIVVNDTIVVDEGGVATTLHTPLNAVSVLVNDNDSDLNDYIVVDTNLIASAKFGNFVMNSDGTFSYTHNGSENFTDSVIYKAIDTQGASTFGTVYIVINPVNDEPSVVQDSIVVVEAGSTTVLVNGDTSVIDNDSDGDINGKANWVVKLVTDVKFGTLILDSLTGTFKYVHEGSQNYKDEFKYQVVDGEFTSEVVTVPIKIIATLSNLVSSGYYDADADGNIDSIAFKFEKPISSIDSIGISIKWDKMSTFEPVKNLNFAQTDSGEDATTIVASLDGIVPANEIKTSGAMSAIISYMDFDSTVTVSVSDKAAPVVISAEYIYNGVDTADNFDKIVVRFSESTGDIIDKNPFKFTKLDKTPYGMDLSLNLHDSNATVFRVVQLVKANNPDKGDSVWINFDSYVPDLFGNSQLTDDNRKVELIIRDVDFIFNASVLTQTSQNPIVIPDELNVMNSSGNIGSVILLQPSISGTNTKLPDFLFSELNASVIIYDAVGNRVNGCNGVGNGDNTIQIGVKNIGGANSIVINWLEKNYAGRTVGGGSYLAVVSISNGEKDKNEKFKLLLNAKGK